MLHYTGQLFNLLAKYCFYLQQIHQIQTPPTSIMSEDTTAQQNSSKRTRRSTDGGGGSNAAFGGHGGGSAAAASSSCAVNQAGSTKQVGSTTSPPAAALVLKDKFNELLHIMLQLFLQPLATLVLSKFATAFYANKNHNETKSD